MGSAFGSAPFLLSKTVTVCCCVDMARQEAYGASVEREHMVTTIILLGIAVLWLGVLAHLKVIEADAWKRAAMASEPGRRSYFLNLGFARCWLAERWRCPWRK